MRSAFGSLLFGAAFVLAAAVAAPLTQEALRSSSNANPIISRLRDFDVARPVAEGSVFSALAGSVDASLPSTIGYSLSAFGRSFKLQLSKNDALLSPNYRQMRIDFSTPEGKEVSAPQPAAIASCYYIGSVENDEESVVAVNLCGGLKGVIKTKDETYNIEPALTSSSSSASASIFSASPADSTIEHIVFRDSDVRSEEGEDEAAKSHFRCGVHDDGEIADAIREELSHAAATESQPVADEYTIELLAFNDHARYKSKGDGVEQETIQLANIASAYYAKTKFVRPLKMVLVGQVTFLNNDPYPVKQAGSGVEVENTDGLLWTFNKWRTENKDRLPAHDSGQLLSGLTFTSGIRGLAGVGAMCSPNQSGSICQLTSPSPRLNAMIMAHETGHTLSMLHDTMGNSCPMGNVMQPTVSEADSFSSCSIEYTNQFLSKQPGPQCLANKVNVQSAVVARWDSDAVRMREPAAERRLSKAGEVLKQYWLAFLLGAAFGAAMAASVGIVLHGLALRRADNATKAMGLPTSSSLTSVSQADFYPITRSGTADSFPGHAAPAGNAV